MRQEQIEITLTKDKLREILKAYQLLSDFFDMALPKELLYKEEFRRGLDSALKEVKDGKSQKIHSFDEFIK